eukprot:1761257-Rhodomonas_salina.2
MNEHVTPRVTERERPARTTARLEPHSPSIFSTRVSSTCPPYELPLRFGSSTYASSIKSTFPRQRSRRSLVFFAAPPSASPVRSAGVHDTSAPLDSSPSSFKRPPYNFATVVLPVPGLP